MRLDQQKLHAQDGKLTVLFGRQNAKSVVQMLYKIKILHYSF